MPKIEESTFFGMYSQPEGITCTIIPDLQRDYVQGRDDPRTKSVLNNLIQDVKKALVGDYKCNLGFVYGSIENGDRFKPIDGQQRLTFLFILHFYVYFRVGKVLENDFKLTYETRDTSKRFFECLAAFKQKGSDRLRPRKSIEDAPWFQFSWTLDPTIQSALEVLDAISDAFADADPKLLYKKLRQKKPNKCGICFSCLRIEDIGDGGDLFVKMNARGKPLTEWEIFKPFISTHCGFGGGENLFDTDYLEVVWQTIDAQAGHLRGHYCDAFMFNLCRAVINNLCQFAGEELLEDKYAVSAQRYKNHLFSLSSNKYFSSNGALLDEAGQLVRSTFDLLYASRSNPTIMEFFFGKDHFASGARKYTQPERVLLFAISVYAKNRFADRNNPFDLTHFSYFFRSLHNIVFSSDIDNEKKMQGALQGVKALTERLIGAALLENDFYGSLSILETTEPFLRLDPTSIKEEREKAGLITSASNRGPIISALHRVEDTMSYFRGNITFVLRLCGLFDNNDEANSSNVGNAPSLLDDVIQNLGYFFDVRNGGGLKPELDEGGTKLFRRALLTYGDYSIPSSVHSAIIRNFFYEGDNGYFTWRRFMREETQFSLFQQLFSDFLAGQPKDTMSFLEHKIASYSKSPTNREKWFIHYLIREPEVFKYMGSNVFSTDESGQLVLFKKKNRNGQQRAFITEVIFLELKRRRPHRYSMKKCGDDSVERLMADEEVQISLQTDSPNNVLIKRTNQLVTVDWANLQDSLRQIVEQLGETWSPWPNGVPFGLTPTN